ncbi:MAG: phosphoesterase [Barrevirus sp.]|uniref:Phosphoesterase n=1 Tax=Barrevirus sp. TaxID=2487763 RepID=A0A3G4ZPJ3_9VIRU|nr:MAG: phosphoesterase [Barrevirus sp.]
MSKHHSHSGQCKKQKRKDKKKVKKSCKKHNKRQKWMIIIYENDSQEVFLSSPNFANFAKKGTLFTGYEGVMHPSQPNYIALISGSNYNVTTDLSTDVIPKDAKTIVDLLEAHGYSWKAYAENYPTNPIPYLGDGSVNNWLNTGLDIGAFTSASIPHCYPDKPGLGQDVHYAYTRKHLPFISFDTIVKNPGRAKNLVNASTFSDDLLNDELPDFILYIPNMFNNCHDTQALFDLTTCKENMMGLGTADYCGEAFHNTFNLALNSKKLMKDRIVAVIGDEGTITIDNSTIGIFYGDNVKKNNIVPTVYNHYNLLRTIEDTMKIGTLGKNDSIAEPMKGWQKYN